MELRHSEKAQAPITTALDRSGELLSALQGLGVRDTIIAEALLQEVAWMIEALDGNTSSLKAVELRRIVSWFSEQCGCLVASPELGGRRDRQ